MSIIPHSMKWDLKKKDFPAQSEQVNEGFSYSLTSVLCGHASKLQFPAGK